jgi:hypothetical protein
MLRRLPFPDSADSQPFPQFRTIVELFRLCYAQPRELDGR